MRQPTLSEKSKVWRIPRFHDLELLRGTSLTQSFPRHTHERYAIGVVEQGALGYFYRGENIVALPGNINLCMPDEVHTGQPAAAEGWSYRMFYFDVTMLQQIASEVAGRPRHLPFFQAGVIADVCVARQLRQLHRQLETAETPLLEQETVLLDVLAQVIHRYADAPPPLRRPGQEPRAVTQLKRYIESHYAEDMSSRVCPTSPNSVAIISFASFVKQSASRHTRTSVRCALSTPKTCSRPDSPWRMWLLPLALRIKAISRDGAKGCGALPLDNTATAYKTAPPQPSTFQPRVSRPNVRAFTLHKAEV